MRRFASLSVWCLCIIGGSSLAQDNIAQLLPTDQSVERYGLVRRWFAYAPVDGLRESIKRVTVVGDQIHLQTNASRLHVLDSETGRLLWSAQMGIPTSGQFGSAINSDSVFVINGSRMYRLSRDDGSQLWSVRLPQAPNAAPNADEDRVIVSTLDGRLVVYNSHTKEIVWFYQTNGPISTPAALLDDKIACASQDGKMYVFQPTSRNPTVRYQTEAPVSAPIATWGKTALLPSQDFNLYAVDVRNGDTQWRYSSGSEIRRPVSVIDNDVYLAPEDGGMHALNAETGSRLWRHPRAQEFVAASKTRVYAGDRFRQVLILDRATGRQLGAWNTNPFDFRASNESNDRIYLVTKTGLVVCLHEKENQDPVNHPKVLPPSIGAETKTAATPPAPGSVK
jgi:outer membrane protein assembly factor BamB